jgi:glycosyltransferase A (GT-A) superfamily protein (DUF2064 family)
MKTDCVAILANRPEEANYLSPLVPLIGYKRVEYLYRAMLFDTIAAGLETKGASVELFYRPPQAETEFQQLLNLFQGEESDEQIVKGIPKIELAPVSGKNISSRISEIFDYSFEKGFKRVVLITNSSPTINPEIIRAALAMLKDNDAIIGPSFDGDCYVIGLAKNYPELFKRIPESKHDRYVAIKGIIEKASIKLQELEISYMVSSAEELNQLIDDIECWRKIGDSRTAMHTERFLRTIG